MTLTNLTGHLYYSAGNLFAGAVGTDATIDWTNDTIMLALVGVYGGAPYVQDKTQKYWSDVLHFDIGATGTYTAAGMQLVTLAPYTDSTTAAPFYYNVMTASHASIQAPTAYSTTNGIQLTNMTYSAMVGAICYKKTAGANTTWPLIGYLDLSGGAINTVLTGAGPLNTSGQKTVGLTSGTGFVNGQSVMIADANASETNVIASGQGTTTLTMTTNLAHTYSSTPWILQCNTASADKCIIYFDQLGLFKGYMS